MTKFAEILFQHRIRFIALALIPIALGGAVAVLFASYPATATLRIEDPSAFGASFVPAGWSAGLTPAQNLADSVGQVVKTRSFSQSLSDQLTNAGTVSSTTALQQTVASTVAGLTATPSNSHLLALTYSCSRPSVCLAVLSDTIDIFQRQMDQIQQAQTVAASTFWSAQLKDAQTNLASALTALHDYSLANPTVAVDGSSSDPQVQQLLNDVQQWRANVAEAQNSLSQAQYLGTASARFLQVGTTLVDPAHIAGSRFVGDRTSLVPALLVLLAGLVLVGAYLLLLARLDRTAGDPAALERHLGVPVVATIPKLVSSRGF
jgi:capsular polysaccharide biosynthesis protein